MNDKGATLPSSYADKPAAYYENARTDYVNRLPLSSHAKVLELGCGNGATGALALHGGRCSSYVGIEMFEPMARTASEVLTAVHIGNVEHMELPYSAGSFDALIMSEVLEHLVDPLATLERLVKLVRIGGLVLASSPNISHYKVILELIRGRFNYEESGVMDGTHLRWFTPTSFALLFDQAGVALDHMGPLALAPFWQRALFSPRRHLGWYQINYHGHRVR